MKVTFTRNADPVYGLPPPTAASCAAMAAFMNTVSKGSPEFACSRVDGASMQVAGTALTAQLQSVCSSFNDILFIVGAACSGRGMHPEEQPIEAALA